MDIYKQIVYTGLVAQEVEPIIPEAVTFISCKDGLNGKGNYLLKNDKIVPYLIKAIQEQHEIINELLNRVSVLEKKGITGVTGITGPTGTTL